MMRSVILTAFVLLSCGGEDLSVSSQATDLLEPTPRLLKRPAPLCAQAVGKYSNICIKVINGCFLIVDDLCAGEPIFRMISGEHECGTIETSTTVDEEDGDWGHCIVERQTSVLYEGRSFVALEQIFYNCEYMPCYAVRKFSGQRAKEIKLWWMQ
ncbi:MAG: hypothetical protein ACWGQW_01465 [bacterium]